MIGIIIPIFNRPEYVAATFASLLVAHYQGHEVMFILINDSSTDKDILVIISEFASVMREKESVQITVVNRARNKGVRKNILDGVEVAIGLGCTLFLNLDSDAIVKPEFLHTLVSLRNVRPECIVSGFNAISEVNPVKVHHAWYVEKDYANGINMLFDKEQYEKYVRPSLQIVGNWDQQTSFRCQAENIPFLVTSPSVVQHIGMVSSMGHTDNGVKADQADDF